MVKYKVFNKTKDDLGFYDFIDRVTEWVNKNDRDIISISYSDSQSMMFTSEKIIVWYREQN